VVLVILMGLLRAMVAPLILLATVVLSFVAALGVSALAFDHVFGFAGADTSFPLFVFVFLVALGIDYNIFLMTRIREKAARGGPRRGALAGLAATGYVITSAGAVLAGTFAVLGTLPVPFLAELGFAVWLFFRIPGYTLMLYLNQTHPNGSEWGESMWNFGPPKSS
jgi:RND superfamily putative drug exporter